MEKKLRCQFKKKFVKVIEGCPIWKFWCFYKKEANGMILFLISLSDNDKLFVLSDM